MSIWAKKSNLSISLSQGDTEAPRNSSQTTASFYDPIVGCLDSIQDKFQGGSILGSIFTLIMVSLGTGLLGLPYAIQQSGILWGILQLAICGVLGYYSLTIVVACANIQRASSYQELAEKTFGKKLRNLVNIIFFFGSAGTATVYFQVIASLAPVFISAVCDNSAIINWMNGDSERKIIPVIVATVFVLPLSLPKEFKKLRYLWLLGCVLTLFISVMIVSETFIYNNPVVQSSSLEVFNISGFSTTFPTGVFAYTCHFSILDVYGEFRNPTKKRMQKVILSNTICVFVIYLFVGIFAYITFGDSTTDSLNRIVLLAYIENNPNDPPVYPNTVLACIIIMCVVLIAKTPMYIRPAKDGLKDFFFPKKSDRYGEPIETNESTLTHFLLVALTIYFGALIALFAESTEIAMTIIGSSFYAMVCFILPAIFYLGLPKEFQRGPDRVGCWIMLVLMTGFGVWNTVENIKKAIGGES